MLKWALMRFIRRETKEKIDERRLDILGIF